MNKEIDALVARVAESLTNWDGKTHLYAPLRSALMEARALGLEEAIQLADEVDTHLTDEEQREWIKARCRALKGE